MDKLSLKRLQFVARHGCFEEEKLYRQPFVVSIDMGLDTRPAAQTDDLAHSVDYSRIYLQVKDEVENHSYNLIETLAERIAQLVLQQPAVHSVRVEVEKSKATVEGQQFVSAVSIERTL